MATPSSVTIPTADGPMPADWFPPPRDGAPVLVLCQEIFGVTAYIRRRAGNLAAQGYGVLVPHFFWRLGPDGTAPVIAETGTDALQQAMALAGRLDFDTAAGDGVRACAVAGESGGRVGLIGFCFGGGLAFAIAARTDADALVSYYGSGLPGLLELAPDVRCPSLHHFGEADSFIDAGARARIRAAVTAHGALWRDHPGADHAFDNDDGAWYHAAASATAWATTVEFLRRELPPDGPTVPGRP